MQNAASGVVTLSPKFCHITPVLANLPWLPTDLRIDFKILIVTYYTLHGLAPAYIQDLLQSYLSARDLRFSKKIYFPCLLLTWTVIAVVFLLLLRLDLWNSLPHHIRDAGSLDS